MTMLTPVLSAYWDDPESWTLDTYRAQADRWEASQTPHGPLPPGDGQRPLSRFRPLRL